MRMFLLALRNFWRQRQRYLVLLTLVALGAALSLVLLAATTSLTQTLKAKAALYFGGEVSVLGLADDGLHRFADEGSVVSLLRTIPSEALFRRTVSYNRDSVLFFKDHSLKQRRMIGVDIAVEHTALQALDFDEGGTRGLETGDGILVSRGTADKLRVQVGDTVTLLIDTVKGSKNTVQLVVAGIFHDTSFFGFSSYLPIETLNRALELPPGTCTDLGLSLPPGSSTDQTAQKLHSLLSQKLKVLPLFRTKDDFDNFEDQSAGGGDRYLVMTLDARLAQIRQILEAVLAVSAVLNLLFLAIVVLGVGNTFRAVLVERTREIGVWRALGMARSQLVAVVLAEVAILAACGGLVGTVAGTVTWTALTLVDWGGHPLAAMFLVRGHLAWVLPWAQEGLLFAVMLLAGVAGALVPALRAARWRPVDSLRYRI